MNSFKKIISAAVITLVVIASCKKEEQFETVPTNPATPTGSSQSYTSIQDFFNQNGAPVQTFTLNASTGGTFVGAQGSTFTFSANSFVTSAGAPVSGNVTVQLRELLTKKDMILSGVPPMSFGNALRTGGEYNIKVMQGPNVLKLAPWVTYTAALPAATTVPGMDVYNGDVAPATSDVNWVANIDSSNFVFATTAPTSYLITCDSLNWINCDQPYSSASPGLGILNVTGASNMDWSNSKIFAVVTNDKVACTMYENISIANQFEWSSAPMGYAGTFVVIYVHPISQLLYAGIQNVTFSATPVTVNLTQTTEAALNAQLALLY